MLKFLRSGAFRAALTFVALGFVAYSAWTLYARWEQHAVAIDTSWTCAALGAAIGAMWLMAVAWSVLIQDMTPSRPPLLRMLAVYATSTLGKYVPGKVGQPVMRIAGLAAYGGSSMSVMASMIIEILSWAATGGVIAVAIFGFVGRSVLLPLGYLQLMAVLLLLGTGVLVALPRQRYPKFLAAALGGELPGPVLPWKVPLAHVASWTLWSVQGALIMRALGETSWNNALFGSAFFVLAPIAGFLALPLPAGVGVRESLVVLGLSPLLGPERALTAALLSRAASIAADVVIWLAFSRQRPLQSAPVEPPAT